MSWSSQTQTKARGDNDRALHAGTCGLHGRHSFIKELLISYNVLQNSTSFPETILFLVVFIMPFIVSSSAVCFIWV